METESKVLDIISKLMNEEYEEINSVKKAFIIFKKFFLEEFVTNLDQGLYSDNASIISQIKEEIEEMEFFDNVPQLLGKQFVNIFSSVNDFYKNIDYGSEINEVLMENDGIPVVLVNKEANDESSIYAITYSNQMVQITEKEIELIFSQFDEKGIEKRKLIKFFLIKEQTGYDNICFCVWPERLLEGITYDQYFLKNTSLNILMGKSESHIQRKLLSIRKTELFILLSENVNKTIYDNLSSNRKQQVKGCLSVTEFLNLLQERNVETNNYNVSNKIQSILLNVEKYYYNIINHLKENEKTMIEDLVHLPEGNVRESISEYLKHQKEREKVYLKVFDDYKNICNEMIKRISIYQKCRRKIYGKDDLDYIYYYDENLENIFIELVNIGEYDRAKECLRCMKDNNVKDIEVYVAYFDYSFGNAISEETILKLKNNSYDKQSLARILIAMSSVVDNSFETLLDYSNYLKSPATAFEYYLFGRREILNKNYELASDYLKKAYENGFEETANDLIKLAIEHADECNITLIDLAKMMIPEANYLMGITALEDNEDVAIVHIKIAAAKKHKEAIELIAEILFESVRELSYAEMKEKQNQENVFNVINLYEYLLAIDNNVEYQEKVGLMYCKARDYRRALDKLSKIETSESCYQCALIYENGLGVAVNLLKARDYYQKCGNYKDASVQFVKINEDIKNKSESSNSSRNNFKEEREVVSVERSGFCFITTAACMVLKKDKNCDELNMLRAFRDQHISDGGVGDLLISEYYRIGPIIVDKIEREWNPNGIYMQLWNYYISPSCKKIKEKKYDDAKKIYIDMVKRMCMKYHIEVEPTICEKYDIEYQ